jgi:HPt (histidine-containing phosphotransfer) domain-containing protein
MPVPCGETEFSSSDPGFWDGAAIWKIHKAGGAELVGKLCGLFLEEAGQRVDDLRSSVLWSDVKRVAHGFKTNCRMMGAEKMADLCHELVVRSEKGVPPEGSGVTADEAADLSRWVDELQAAYQEIQVRIEQIHEAALRGETPPGTPPD